MNKTRKGFTLVELLIVVAILSSLTAAMTVAVSGSSAKAKAATIAHNVAACRSAAALYVINNDGSTNLSEMTAGDVLKKCMPAWADFSDKTNTNAEIKYAEDTTTNNGKGSANWAITVDFSNDPEKADIKTALKKIKGYGKYYNDSSNEADIMPEGDKNYGFKVMLSSGKIMPYATSTSTTPAEGSNENGGG